MQKPEDEVHTKEHLVGGEDDDQRRSAEAGKMINAPRLERSSSASDAPPQRVRGTTAREATRHCTAE